MHSNLSILGRTASTPPALRRLFDPSILCSLFFCLAALAGCATTGSGTPTANADGSGGSAEPGATASTNDPLEPVNRVVYRFNDTFDRWLLQPIAQGYVKVVPMPVRSCARNVFNNIGDIPVALNDALQGRLKNAAGDAGRLALNSTIGIFGCFDVASEAGLEKHRADFGLTLGVWGFAPGPYLMLPLLGPSTLRDTVGLFTLDAKTNAVLYIRHIPTRNETYALEIADKRASLLDARNFMQDAALDPYVFLREAYLSRRRTRIQGESPSGAPQNYVEPSSPGGIFRLPLR